MKFRAFSDFDVHYPRPLEVSKGDRVLVGRRDSEWPQWLWVTDASGVSAWVHESVLEIAGEQAVLREDFSARELSVKKDEVLESMRLLGGWHWCRKASGEMGWIPEYNLEVLP
jgi:SH3-like domain-containing protein